MKDELLDHLPSATLDRSEVGGLRSAVCGVDGRGVGQCCGSARALRKAFDLTGDG